MNKMTIREKIESIIRPVAETFCIPPGAEADLVRKLDRMIREEKHRFFDACQKRFKEEKEFKPIEWEQEYDWSDPDEKARETKFCNNCGCRNNCEYRYINKTCNAWVQGTEEA